MARPPALLHLAAQPARSTAVPLARIPSPPHSHSNPKRLASTATTTPGQPAHKHRQHRTWLGTAWGRRDTHKHAGQQQRAFHASARQLAKNPYGVLGVAKDAASSDIKKAYYQLAKKYHPDSSKEKDAKERFVEIQEAYDTLSDDKKRADFDRFGAASQQPGFDSDAYARATSSFGGAGFGDFFGGGMGGMGGAGGPSGADIFDSLFGAFGRGAGAAGPRQTVQVGDDIEVSVSVPFIDAAKGASRTVPISPVVDCHTCHGSGMKEGVKKTTCASCGGTGTRTFTIQSGFQMASTCGACGGSGSTAPPGSDCGTCAGVGKVRERRTVEVKIPPGVEDGMRIRLDGKGDAPLGGAGAGSRGRNGDLYVRVNVQPSKVFTRQGSNLYQTVSVPFYTAILGGRAPVQTLDRDVEVRVPQGTQPGEEMVLRGRGVKKLYKDEYGDLVVKFNVTMPRSLTPTQRLILQQYVAETEIPGSTAHYPNPASPSSSSADPSASPSSSASAAAAADKPPRSNVDDRSPAFEQQAKPPPSDRSAKTAWWSTMNDDLTSSRPDHSSSSSASPSSSPAGAAASASAPEPTPASEPTPTAESAAEPAQQEQPAKASEKADEKVSFRDLWKAGKDKLKKAREEVKDKVGCEEGDKAGEKKEKKEGKEKK
ncbi:hypothetical protein JCM10207_008144 [Rhodosporidiobolus poonsookiae]